MNRKIRFYAFSLMILFFISTSGVTVYKHFCAFDGVSYGLFTSPENHCMMMDDGQEAITHECCSFESNQEVQFNNNCCSEGVNVYQIESDLNTNHSEIAIVSVVYGVFPFVQSVFANPVNDFAALVNHSVDSKPIHRRLSLIQSYLI